MTLISKLTLALTVLTIVSVAQVDTVAADQRLGRQGAARLSVEAHVRPTLKANKTSAMKFGKAIQSSKSARPKAPKLDRKSIPTCRRCRR